MSPPLWTEPRVKQKRAVDRSNFDSRELAGHVNWRFPVPAVLASLPTQPYVPILLPILPSRRFRQLDYLHARLIRGISALKKHMHGEDLKTKCPAISHQLSIQSRFGVTN